MKKLKNIITNNLIWIIIFIILSVLCYAFPYTGDDWAWGSSIGIERLNTFFSNYNGRYLGNLCVLILTRSHILRAITMSLVITGILYLINKTIKIKKIYLISYIILFLMIMPINIFRESISWTSGFSNYVMPTLGIIFTISYFFNKGFQKEETKSKTIIISLILLIISFSVSLFMEHITIYNLILGIFLLIYTIIKSKPNIPKAICYLLGSISGTITMFSNTAYQSILSQTDTYRQIENPSINTLLTTLINEVLDLLVYNNYIILGIIIILIIYIINKTKTKETPKIILTIILSLNLFYLIITNLVPDFKEILNQGYLKLTISIVLYITLIISLKYIKKPYKNKILFLLISIIILAGPLLIVKPIGPRCFFIIYILYIFISLILIDYTKNILKLNYNKGFKITLITISTISLIYIFIIYGNIYIKDKQRLEYVKQNIKTEQKITLHRLPYEERLHCSYIDTGNGLWEMRYKLFNNIPEDINLIYEK